MIDVDSRVGLGTRFDISLPLSVATTRCLMVEVGGQAFALPISGIDRIVRLTAGDIGQTEGREAVRVDGRPMALARLGDVISPPASSRAAGAAQPAIVLGSGERRVAFMVERPDRGAGDRHQAAPAAAQACAPCRGRDDRRFR